jgi:hypothetical protein
VAWCGAKPPEPLWLRTAKLGDHSATRVTFLVNWWSTKPAPPNCVEPPADVVKMLQASSGHLSSLANAPRQAQVGGPPRAVRTSLPLPSRPTSRLPSSDGGHLNGWYRRCHL